MSTFDDYFMQQNGNWQQHLDEVKEVGFEKASSIARLVYECEIGNINQHASEDLKWISAKLSALRDEIEALGIWQCGEFTGISV
jgi:hypothetical protein